MPRGIGRPKGRKSAINPLTHGGNRLEVRQRTEPSRTTLRVEKRNEDSAKRMNTKTKLIAMK